LTTETISLNRFNKVLDVGTGATAQIIPQDDGRVVLEMDVADIDEVKRWLMGFGAPGEVLTPLDLRKMVTEELVRT
jgi:predicted DNA-binding transcriptional regulator YafY